MRNAPVPPSGWPRAMAPPLGLVFVEVGAELLGPGQHDRGERLVDLEHVDVVDRQAGALEQALGGVDRAGEHEHRVDADEAGVDDAGPRREAERVGLARRSSAARRRRRRRSATRCRRCARRPRGRPASAWPASRASSRAGPRRGSTVWVRAGRLAVLVDVGRVDRRRTGRRSGPRPTPGRRAAASARPNASVSSRVMPHLSAMRSAPSNCEVNS